MQKFIIYPKKDEPFTVEFKRFELKENGFILYDDADKESKDGFLSVANVAAIIPEQQREKDMICFHVYLRNRPEPIEVFAHALDEVQEPSVSFKYQQKDIMDKVYNEWSVDNIYISPSEVVAICPSDGLRNWRR